VPKRRETGEKIENGRSYKKMSPAVRQRAGQELCQDVCPCERFGGSKPLKKLEQ
jgi:hypothetical protein